MKTIFRYLAAGGTSYALELAVLFVLTGLGMSSIWAVALAFWVGFFVAFVLQKTFAFQGAETGKKKTAVQLALYGLLVAFNYGFTIAFVGIFDEHSLFITRTIALVITTFWNFFLYKFVVFRKSN